MDNKDYEQMYEQEIDDKPKSTVQMRTHGNNDWKQWLLFGEGRMLLIVVSIVAIMIIVCGVAFNNDGDNDYKASSVEDERYKERNDMGYDKDEDGEEDDILARGDFSDEQKEIIKELLAGKDVSETVQEYEQPVNTYEPSDSLKSMYSAITRVPGFNIPKFGFTIEDTYDEYVGILCEDPAEFHLVQSTEFSNADSIYLLGLYRKTSFGTEFTKVEEKRLLGHMRFTDRGIQKDLFLVDAQNSVGYDFYMVYNIHEGEQYVYLYTPSEISEYSLTFVGYETEYADIVPFTPSGVTYVQKRLTNPSMWQMNDGNGNPTNLYNCNEEYYMYTDKGLQYILLRDYNNTVDYHAVCYDEDGYCNAWIDDADSRGTANAIQAEIDRGIQGWVTPANGFMDVTSGHYKWDIQSNILYDYTSEFVEEIIIEETTEESSEEVLTEENNSGEDS